MLLAAAGLAAGLAGWFALPGAFRGATDESSGERPAAPLFSLPGLSGAEIRLADFRGKVVILDFWATWCPPCEEGIPDLNRLQKEYRDRGLAVIGISLDRGEADGVRRFLDRLGVEYPNALGSEELFAAYNALPGLGRIRGVPAAFVIDREGRVRKKFVGLTRKEAFAAAVRPLL